MERLVAYIPTTINKVQTKKFHVRPSNGLLHIVTLKINIDSYIERAYYILISNSH